MALPAPAAPGGAPQMPPPPSYNQALSSTTPIPQTTPKHYESTSSGVPFVSSGQPTIMVMAAGAGAPMTAVNTESPAVVQCYNCRQVVTSSTEHVVGACAIIAACVLCLFVCWPIAWVPLCINGFQDVAHNCPSCGARLGAP